MPRAQTETVNANFSKGFITETGPLGYPENSCKDMDNLVLERNGSVRVRNGLVVPDNRNAQPIFSDTQYSVHYWDNPAGDGESFVVVQVGGSIKCLSTEGSYIGHTSLTARGSTPSGDTESLITALKARKIPDTLSSVQSRGRLYMTSKETGPFYLEYLPNGRAGNPDFKEASVTTSSPTVQIVAIRPKYRDVFGLNDGLDVDERPAEDIPEHRYNLMNAGWPKRFIDEFRRGRGGPNYPDYGGVEYPARADYFWLGYSLNPNDRDSTTEEFIGRNFYKFPVDTSPAPMGKYILDVFNPSRSEKSGIENLPERGRTVGPNAIGFFAGRAWYAGFNGGGFEDNVLFSNVLPFQSSVDFDEEVGAFLDTYAGMCYQKNDPTAREVNDLVDDDGGVITIPGLGKVMGMVSLKNTIIVISDKGAWAISGGIEPFSANNYTVNKITSVGCVSPQSVVELEGATAYWGYGDIVLIGEQQGGSVAQSMTDTNIKTFYISIPLENKQAAYGHYDIVEKKIYWTHSNGKVLIYDTVLGAFNKYSLLQSDSGPVLNREVQFFTAQIRKTEEEFNDVFYGDLDVITSTGDVITDYYPFISDISSGLMALVPYKNNLLIAEFDKENSGNYYDMLPKEFHSATDDPSLPVKAYLEAGAQNFGDLMRSKEAFRVFCYFETKEYLGVPSNYTLVENGSNSRFELDYGISPLNKTSCKVQGRWEWTTTPASGKYSRQQQAYKSPRIIVYSDVFPEQSDVDLTSVNSTGTSPSHLYSLAQATIAPDREVTVSRMRVRGSGKTLNLYFENEPGKGFHLLGWAAPVLVNKRP